MGRGLAVVQYRLRNSGHTLPTLPMKDLKNRLFNTARLKELEATAAAHTVQGDSVLMERAGARAFELIRELYADLSPITVLCGAGDNGGDGMVLAREARRRGYRVSVVCVSPPTSDDAIQAWHTMLSSGVKPVMSRTVKGLPDQGIIVDAIVGTGLLREPEGEVKRLIMLANQSSAHVLSLDCPSGLYADTGVVSENVVAADSTLSFIGLKPGFFCGGGPDVTGQLVLCPLDVTEAAYDSVEPTMYRISANGVRDMIPSRLADAHKGQSGHVLVIGGDEGMGGAVKMCAEAALRCGSGLVSVLTHSAHAAAIMAARPELMVQSVTPGEDVSDKFEKASVIAIGPGLGRGAFGRYLFELAMTWCEAGRGDIVVDADGLNLLAEQPGRYARWVLTPHVGEAARLLEGTTEAVAVDRQQALSDMQKRYGGTVVLKGAGTIISDGERTWLCDRGNPGMASGGMGDVLTGVIAALIAQGVPRAKAAQLGVWLHARAGDECVARHGTLGLVASDVVPLVREQMNILGGTATPTSEFAAGTGAPIDPNSLNKPANRNVANQARTSA